jgi:hypothetical protein
MDKWTVLIVFIIGFVVGLIIGSVGGESNGRRLCLEEFKGVYMPAGPEVRE